MSDLAFLYLKQGKYAEAEPLLREALKGLDKATPGDWKRYNAQSMLGASLTGQRKYAEGETLLLSGYEGLLQRQATIPADSRFKLKLAGSRIIQLYEAWGKAEKASEWQAKLRLMPSSSPTQ